jgi:exopolysaccharide biosynthesis polyprenyl glycosylphosphotransferase
VTTLNSEEAIVEQTTSGALSLPTLGTQRWDGARQTLRDGRIRTAGTTLVAAVLATAYQPSLGAKIVVTIGLAGCWLLATHLVERSLRIVAAVAGNVGRIACGAAAGLALASGLAYWTPTSLQITAGELALMLLFTFALMLLLEAAKARIAPLRTRVLLVGGGRSTRDLIEMLAQAGGERFAAVGVVGDETEAAAIGGVPMLGGIDVLDSVVAEQKPDLVVLSVEKGRPDVFSHLAKINDPKFRIVGVPEFFEHAFGRVPIRNMTDAWFMSVLHLYQRPYSAWAKRGFDIVVALFGLLLTAPLFGVLALLVRGSGPVFYRQTRLGEHGEHFTIFKFRTMYPDAETNGAVWAAQGDPRTTEIGRLLRRSRLDELPQLINVLRGDMSIVGPRPERPEFLDQLEETVPFWSRRHLLKPGITGWAQLRAGYASDSLATEEKLSYDLWYLRHQSLVVDFLICARTLPSQLFTGGR